MLAPKDLVDFHTHSTASDGTTPPYQIIIQAHDVGVRMVALTDHDTVDGLEKFIFAAPRYRIRAIPGIEISSQFGDRRLHVLGLGMRRRSWPDLEAFLQRVRSWRHERNEKMVQRINDLGMPLTLEEVDRERTGQILARPHFARAMVERGYVGSMQEAFDRVIGRDGPGYVAKRRPSPTEAVEILHETGALAIIAHPNSLVENDGAALEPVLAELLHAGFDGVEAYHPDMSPEQTRDSIEFALKRDVLVAGGSDFHGRNKKSNYLGRVHGGRKLFAEQVAPLIERLEAMPRW
jgi:predicted metal-dependent phosphoesterase TrpH